jgi:uncharacterized protein
VRQQNNENRFFAKLRYVGCNKLIHYLTQPSTISAKKRIQLLDILRGFALFGILLVNANDYRLGQKLTNPNFNELNVWFNNIVIALGDGSFYPLFSFLFGIGFAIWMDKSMKQNGGALRFAWRSFILLILGCLFYVLVEDRNILIRYSILSIPLLFFYKARPKILFVSSVFFFLVYIFYDPLYTQLIEPRSNGIDVHLTALEQSALDAAQEVKKSPTYLNFTKARMASVPLQIKMSVTFGHQTLPIILSMFLLGTFFWKKKLLTDYERYHRVWRNLFWWGLILGVGGNLFVFFERIMFYKKLWIPNGTNVEVMRYIESVANPLLTIFYVSLFVQVINKRHGKPSIFLSLLASTGRIPLTNYFIQYIIMSLLMLPYGFGLDGKLFTQQLCLITITIFICQVIFSSFWTNRFIYGPMEWLWRSLTYLRFQPMKLTNQNSVKETPLN